MTQGILVLGKGTWFVPVHGTLTNLIDLSQDAVANIRSAWSKVTHETAFVWSFQRALRAHRKGRDNTD